MAWLASATVVSANLTQLTRLEHGAFAPNNRTPFQSMLEFQQLETNPPNLYLVNGKLRAGQTPLPGWRLVAFSDTTIEGGAPGGGGDPVVSINNQDLTRFTAVPGQAYLGYRINSSGVVQKLTGPLPATTTLETWLLSGAASDYHVRATVLSGAVGGDSTGVWISCADDPQWSIQDSDPDPGMYEVAQLLIEISDDAGSTTLDSATVTLESDYEPA